MPFSWNQASTMETRSFRCGHCGEAVASNVGYLTDGGSSSKSRIYICHFCNRPSSFIEDVQIPGPLFGGAVKHLPLHIEKLYLEAQKSIGASAFTGCVLLARKMLMNIGVDLGASPNGNFLSYISFLADQHFIPANARGWVDHIRSKGNEANHEVILMTETDAKELMGLTEMLLKIVYEFPLGVPGAASTPPTT